MRFKLRRVFTLRYLKHIISTPFILGVFPFLVLLDIAVEIYHRICFPLYNIKYVKRSNYIIIDRHKLKYLSLKQKFFCVYCGYANGLFAYVSNIAFETENYWCKIKHNTYKGVSKDMHKNYLEYGDAKAHKKLNKDYYSR